MGERLRGKKIKGKSIIVSDKRLKDACEALRHHVEHPNERPDIALLNGGIYRQKDPGSVSTATCDGVVIGYQVVPCSPLEINPYFTRRIFVKIPGYRIEDVPKKDREAIMGAVFDTFIGEQQDAPQVSQIGRDALLIEQIFQVAFPVNTKPGLVSIAGGVNIDKKGMVVH